MQFSFAIFDMDGTLVDSMGYWDQTCEEFIHENGVDAPGVIDVLKPLTVQQTVEYLEKELGIHVSVTEMSARMCKIMQAHYEQDVEIKPGVTDFLQALRARGVKMCVASSSPQYLVETCLAKLSLKEYFEFFLSAEEVGKGKTEPDIYYEAARRLHAAPSDTMVFEDAMAAGLTAQKAGFPVTAVWDTSGIAEWEAFHPLADHAILNWKEAEEILL